MAETTREQVEDIINRVTIDGRFYSTDEAIDDVMKLVADRDMYHAERDSLAHGNIALRKEFEKMKAENAEFKRVNWGDLEHLHKVESERNVFREALEDALADYNRYISGQTADAEATFDMVKQLLEKHPK